VPIFHWLSALSRLEVTCFFESSVSIRTTRRYFPEEGDTEHYRYENLKSRLCCNSCSQYVISTFRKSHRVPVA
jgi:hypothetical protein